MSRPVRLLRGDRQADEGRARSPTNRSSRSSYVDGKIDDGRSQTAAFGCTLVCSTTMQHVLTSTQGRQGQSRRRRIDSPGAQALQARSIWHAGQALRRGKAPRRLDGRCRGERRLLRRLAGKPSTPTKSPSPDRSSWSRKTRDQGAVGRMGVPSTKHSAADADLFSNNRKGATHNAPSSARLMEDTIRRPSTSREKEAAATSSPPTTKRSRAAASTRRIAKEKGLDDERRARRRRQVAQPKRVSISAPLPGPRRRASSTSSRRASAWTTTTKRASATRHCAAQS